MNFKRMMLLGAVASALALTGCEDRRAGDTATGGAGNQTQGTGGAGGVDSTIPGSSDTMGGVRQDETRPGTELGGTGGSGSLNDQGVQDQGTSGSLDQGGTGGSGMINDQGTSDSLDQSGVGGSGTKSGKKAPMGAGDAGTPGGSDAGM